MATVRESREGTGGLTKESLGGERGERELAGRNGTTFVGH